MDKNQLTDAVKHLAEERISTVLEPLVDLLIEFLPADVREEDLVRFSAATALCGERVTGVALAAMELSLTE